MTHIKLDYESWSGAVDVGCVRHMLSVNQMNRNEMSPDDSWSYHIEGSCGERAVALFLNIQWTPRINTFRGTADLAGNIEVKTRSHYNYELLVREYDLENPTDTKLFVLVTGRSPHFDIRGWVSSEDLQTEENNKRWRDHAKAAIRNNRPTDNIWLIPHSDLRTDWELFGTLVQP
jgi:hypothetical protein